MSSGPRATVAFLILSAVVFALLLVALGWRADGAGSAVALFVAALVVACCAVIFAVLLGKGVGEGRL